MPHPSVTALRRVGLLGPTQRLSAEPRDLSRAHGVWGVTLQDQRRVVVKSGVLSAGDSTSEPAIVPSLGAEMFVYRMAQWCDELRLALPPALAVDEEAALLVLGDVSDGGAESSLALTWTPAAPAHPVFAALGARLGAIHRATARMPLPPASRPLILGVLHDRPGEYPGPMGDVIPRLAAAPVLVDAAAAASRGGGSCLVHHDLKWDNVALSAAAPSVPIILDWELAGAGDPAWDLGCLLSEHLLRADDCRASLDAAAAAMLLSYARTARISARATDLFARRVTCAAVLRIAQLALEVAERAAPGDDVHAHEIVAMAVAHADRIAERSVEVAGCLAR